MPQIHIADHLARRSDKNIHSFFTDSGLPKPEGSILSGKVELPFRSSHSQGSASEISCYSWGDHFFIGGWDTWNRDPGPLDKRGRATTAPQARIERVGALPVSAKVIGQAYTKMITENVYNSYTRNYELKEFLDTPMAHGYDWERRTLIPPYAYLNLQFSAPEAAPVEGTFKFEQPSWGTAVLDPDGSGNYTVKANFYGLERTFTGSIKLGLVSREVVKERVVSKGWEPRRTETYKTTEPMANDGLWYLAYHLRNSECPDGADAWWKCFVKINPALANLSKDPDKGLAAAYKKKGIKENLMRLAAESPVEHFLFCWLRDGRTKDKRCNNNLLATMLATVGADYEQLKAALQQARKDLVALSFSGLWSSEIERDEYRQDFWFDARRAICLTLPGAKERHEDLEAKADWTKQRDLGLASDSLEITEESFPLLRAAIIEGKIPIGIFQQPDKQPVNREFPIWERALARKGWADPISEIALDASRRGTYDRDVTPYLAFLFRIEKYLDKHAKVPNGKTGWKAMPKYVQSSSELEMSAEDAQGGTVKQRSAFTPVANNETRTVVVPYVAVRVTGAVTQWCYAQQYHVFEEGMTDPISKGIVVNDLEVKLNGRDDYGLCFYTLTGTATATGYPTFLIIFERLAAGTKTRVHFHRVRPCRSKDGITTPACKLVEACYKFMAGNVSASEIVAQQGDLMFLRCDNNPIAAGAKVAEPQEGLTLEFESHKFIPAGGGGILQLYVSEAKQPANRLGFVWAPNGLRVEHPEHENIEHLMEGWWEVRRAKSYENNPVSIWSRTID